MRTYPRNSPRAAARIVALTLVADGHLSPAELAVLDELRAHQQLGLPRSALHEVVHAFCEDLLLAMDMSWGDVCRIDDATLAQLFAEVDDPLLRERVLRLCVAVADADAHLADGEALVLGAAAVHWGLHRNLLEARHARSGSAGSDDLDAPSAAVVAAAAPREGHAGATAG